MLKYQNPSQTLRGVHAKVAELNAQLAAQDVRIVPYIDRDDLVHATVSKVGPHHCRGHRAGVPDADPVPGQPAQRPRGGGHHSAGAGGGVLASSISPRCRPTCCRSGAIDFGILVDGAIVVTEAVLRRREAMPDEELSESEVKAAALQVTRPIFFASLIIITAYLPLFSFERAEAKLFTPMAYTMGYALFGALLTSAGAGARARLLRLPQARPASITTAGSSG